MKIILDDLRKFPTTGDYNCCRTYNDCILLIDIFRYISFISLDYNLNEKHTGYDVFLYLKENNIIPKYINVHSRHIKVIEMMECYIKDNFKDTL